MKLSPIFLSLFLSIPSYGAELWPELSTPPKGLGGGENDAAVIVGAEDYVFVEDIPGARRNAEDWHAYLTDTLGVPAERVALLRDQEATVEELRAAAASKAAEVGPGGTLWFVFIGHGAPSKDGKDGLLVGSDARQSPNSLYARSLPRAELLSIISKGKHARAVVVVDACFSGKSPAGDPLVKGLQPLRLVGLPVAADPRVVLMTAAKADQFAGPLPKSSRMRPAFSFLTLGALRGWAADASGKVTAGAVVAFADKALKIARDRTQTPELTAGAADAVLGAGKEKGPDLARIDREGSEGGQLFQISALSAVPAVVAPKALSGAGAGLDFGSVNVDALEKYSMVLKTDKSDKAPEDKARAWRELGAQLPDYADMSAKRAAEWDRFAEQSRQAEEARLKRLDARDLDWGKLSRLLALDTDVVSQANKRRWAEQFAAAYLESPGMDPEMAKELASHVSAGPLRASLEKAAQATAATPPRARTGATGIDWVTIPGGTFMMGDYNPKQITIRTFQMARTEVTRRQYKACVDAGACTAPTCQWPPDPAHELYPAVCVDWNQAREYSKWVGGRLPSDSEWEFAAKSGGLKRNYPWGDEEATCDYAIIENACAGSNMTAVCSRPKGNSAQGLCDLGGNVWEWVLDWYHSDLSGIPTDGSPWENPPGDKRIIRGGSYIHGASNARTTYRMYDHSGVGAYLGFRPIRPAR